MVIRNTLMNPVPKAARQCGIPGLEERKTARELDMHAGSEAPCGFYQRSREVPS